ncbi:uncharacterized protein LOC133187727 [Saccostrea echinata]|uniref:uncharacterized protein LOC133187727 n=1 Tax=Saccostrea echinata TaxID=191078 RepID=UPI002A814176|nr:uncharacterized protein LOC133187727 [Saccostrea echinata]
MVWIWVSSIIVWIVHVESLTGTSVSFSDLTCALGSTFYTVYSNDDYHLSWDGSFLSKTGGCKITFDPMEALSKVCVEVETFDVRDCSVNVYYIDEGDLKRTYGCGQTPKKFCGSQNADVDVELSVPRTLSSSTNSFRLRIYAYKQYEPKQQDYTWIIGLISVVSVTALIAGTAVLICRRRRTPGLVFQRSEIPHTRLVNTASSEPSPMSFDPPPPYPTNETTATEYTVTVPVIVNTR